MICRNLACLWKQRDWSHVENVSIAVTWTKTTFATLSEQTARHRAKPIPQARLGATVLGDYNIVRWIKPPQDGSDIWDIQERELARIKSTQILLMGGWSADQPKAAPVSAHRWSMQMVSLTTICQNLFGDSVFLNLIWQIVLLWDEQACQNLFGDIYILHTDLKVEECVLLVNNYIELQQKRDREKEVD